MFVRQSMWLLIFPLAENSFQIVGLKAFTVGQCDELAGKGTCCQTLWFEFSPLAWNPYSEKKLTPSSCSPGLWLSVYRQIDTQTCTNKYVNKRICRYVDKYIVLCVCGTHWKISLFLLRLHSFLCLFLCVCEADICVHIYMWGMYVYKCLCVLTFVEVTGWYLLLVLNRPSYLLWHSPPLRLELTMLGKLGHH